MVFWFVLYSFSHKLHHHQSFLGLGRFALILLTESFCYFVKNKN